MTLPALLGVLATLGLVLGLLAVAMRALRRYATGATGRGRLPLEVVQRLALGPKQGIAVVRVGDRLLAVSLGEGGVRPLAELGEAEQALLAAGERTTPRPSLGAALRALAPVASLDAARAAVGRARRPVPAPADATHATAPAASSAIVPTPAAPIERAPVVTPAPAAARVSTPVLSPLVADAPRPAPVRRALLLSPLPGVAIVPERPVAPAAAAPQTDAAVAAPSVPSEAADPDDPSTDPARSARERRDFELLLQLAMQGRRVAAAAALLLAVAVPTAASAQAAPAASGAAAAAAAQPPVVQASPVQPTGPAPLPGVVGRRPQDTRVPPPPPRPQRVAVPGTPAPGVQPPAIARIDTLTGRTLPQLDLRVGGAGESGLRLSGTVGVVVMMGLLTLLPTLVLMMTGFTRILIVLHFLRQALGTQSAPPGHLVAGLALLLTAFVMAPTLREVNETAITPWLAGEMEQTEMLKTGVQPFRAFMLEQTRDSDIRAFLDMSDSPEPATVDDVPLVVLVSAFVTSELRTAFQIGFALFLPFIVIDVVVSSVLMSMGMFMLPPAMISLPFKLLLFVLVDGWALLTQSLVQSFR